MNFALCLTSREFFPENLIGSAREEITVELEKLHFGIRIPPASVFPKGAAGTREDGERFAAWLGEQGSQIDGILLVLPNFGNELAAAEALRDSRLPIYVLAYPDELDKMDFARRRDAFCGKLSIMDVFGQYRIRHTVWAPHTLSPQDPIFALHMQRFAEVCRIVRKFRKCRIGAIGARPGAFKTVRCDEMVLQKYDVSVETLRAEIKLLRGVYLLIHSGWGSFCFS